VVGAEAFRLSEAPLTQQVCNLEIGVFTVGIKSGHAAIDVMVDTRAYLFENFFYDLICCSLGGCNRRLPCGRSGLPGRSV